MKTIVKNGINYANACLQKYLVEAFTRMGAACQSVTMTLEQQRKYVLAIQLILFVLTNAGYVTKDKAAESFWIAH